MPWQKLLSQWTNLKAMIIKQNKELKSLESLTTELKRTLTEKQDQYQALAAKVDPTWTKFLEFCSLYRIEEEYATEARNIGHTIYQEFPNYISALQEALTKQWLPPLQIKNDWKSYEITAGIHANNRIIMTNFLFRSNEQVAKVYDKWRSELFVKVKF